MDRNAYTPRQLRLAEYTNDELWKVAGGWDPRFGETVGPTHGDDARLELARRGEL